ncbi:calmodulin 3 [Olea europaea subsp. europaea]|uniref:Calmodulin 3 n=1 Tax=Olea europaea subsp. europaea TaxID=158383 RepID=A0A8S0TML1_OLEEU|nr:calmodulin 3 [Olea europaea subsp. europaea]
MMSMTMLVLFLLLFIVGLICIVTNPTRKKFIAWNIQFFLHKTPSTNSKFMSENCTTSNKIELKNVFATFDKNHDGFITKKELEESLKRIGISATEKDVEEMVEKVDSNRDGLIDFDEFCKLFDPKSSRDKDEEEEREIADWKEAFDVFDGNKDGVITVEELGLVLSSLGFTEGNKLEYCKEMIRKVDIDGDGMVNFLEFKKMMKAGTRLVPLS